MTRAFTIFNNACLKSELPFSIKCEVGEINISPLYTQIRVNEGAYTDGLGIFENDCFRDPNANVEKCKVGTATGTTITLNNQKMRMPAEGAISQGGVPAEGANIRIGGVPAEGANNRIGGVPAEGANIRIGGVPAEGANIRIGAEGANISMGRMSIDNQVCILGYQEAEEQNKKCACPWKQYDEDSKSFYVDSKTLSDTQEYFDKVFEEAVEGVKKGALSDKQMKVGLQNLKFAQQFRPTGGIDMEFPVAPELSCCVPVNCSR